MHYKLDDIPILAPDYGVGYMRSIKAGDMEIGATWVTCGGVETAELYKGLPGDMCPCDHYGYVFSGSFRIRYLDGSEETVGEGEVYYIPKGHVFFYDEPCHHLEINPHDQLQLLMQHFNRQLADGYDVLAKKPAG
jgi:hypothetical protein